MNLSLETMNGLNWPSRMGEFLAQPLGLFKDSYLVNQIEQSYSFQLLGIQTYSQVQPGSNLVYSSCWFATHIFHKILKANSLMFDSFHCGQPC